LRLNQRATIEAVALPVANFLAETPEPTDKELEKLYQANKDRMPDPTSLEPGFKSPKKVAVQYFKIELEEFVKRAEEQVTDQQIAEYYEKNKDRFFRKRSLPPEAPAEKSAPAEPSSSTSPAEGPNATTPSATPPATTPPADSGAPNTTPPAASPAATDPTPPASPAPGKSSMNVRQRASEESATTGRSGPRFLLVADEKPSATTASPAEPAAPSVSTPPATPPAAASENKTPDTSEAKAPAAETKPAEPAPPVEFEPLEKVKDTIRQTLAREAAAKKIETVADDLMNEMNRYNEDRLVGPDGDAPQREPKPLDFAALAQKYSVAAEFKDLRTAEEFRDETDIGRSFKGGGRAGRKVDFVPLVFGDTLQRYSPDQTTDVGNNQFLFWKTADEPEHAPSFDKVKPEVLRAWKLIAARKIAQEKAAKYLGEVRTKKESLEAAFGAQPNLRVLKPVPFAWMTSNVLTPRDRSGQPPRLSEVEGIESPGNEFMSTVFHLEPGEYGVAMNHPQSTVYVVHLLEFERSLDSLQKQFAEEPFRQYADVAQTDQRNLFFGWVEGVMKDAGVHWVREPLQQQRRR
jgi:hypothetical protein